MMLKEYLMQHLLALLGAFSSKECQLEHLERLAMSRWTVSVYGFLSIQAEAGAEHFMWVT